MRRFVKRAAKRAVILASLLWSSCSGSPTGPSAPATTFLTFNSMPGDYIGQGESHRYALADGVWYALASPLNGPPNQVYIEVTNFTQGWWWSMDFAAPKGQPLKVGTYDAARRYPFQPDTQPGLDFFGSDRGCTTLTGSFQIRELVIGPGNTVDRLHATFEQHCEGASPALTGEVAIVADPWR